MTGGRGCVFCGEPAVWLWAPEKMLLCDDHAAKVDLDELEEL